MKTLEKDLKEAIKEVMDQEMQICKPESIDVLTNLLSILDGNKPLTVDELKDVKETASQFGIEIPELDDALSSLSEDKRNEAIHHLLAASRNMSERLKICFQDDFKRRVERSISKIEKQIQEIKKVLK